MATARLRLPTSVQCHSQPTGKKSSIGTFLPCRTIKRMSGVEGKSEATRTSQKQTPRLSIFCHATRQVRMDRKLSKLNLIDSAAGILVANRRQAPSLVRLHTVQSIRDDWWLNTILALLSTACLGSRRLSCTVVPFSPWTTSRPPLQAA